MTNRFKRFLIFVIVFVFLFINSNTTVNAYENHCWNCGKDISSSFCQRCSICGWYICRSCRACGCLVIDDGNSSDSSNKQQISIEGKIALTILLIIAASGLIYIKYFTEGYWKKGVWYYYNGYSIRGYDENGFNRYGLHKNGTCYDNKGFDINGIDRLGYDENGYNK